MFRIARWTASCSFHWSLSLYDTFWNMMYMFCGHCYLIVLPFLTVFERGHTIRHCSTKLHTSTTMTFSLECSINTCIVKTGTVQRLQSINVLYIFLKFQFCMSCVWQFSVYHMTMTALIARLLYFICFNTVRLAQYKDLLRSPTPHLTLCWLLKNTGTNV